MVALDYRRDDVASALLEQGAKPLDEITAVAKAALLELPRSVALLIGANRQLLEAADTARAPLRMAAVSGAYRTARLLLAGGADPDYGNPLLAAVQENQIHIAHLLLEHGAAFPKPTSPEAGDLLGAAVRASTFTFVDFLLEEGLSANARTSDGSHVLQHAPLHSDEAMGSNNWFQLTAQGADVQSMVCRIDADELPHIEASAPRWYANVVARHRPACPDQSGH